MSCKYWPQISFYIREIDREKSLFKKKPFSVTNIENTRKAIAFQLTQLENNLLETLDNHSTSLILLPIAAELDEEMQQVISENGSLQWPILSKEFCGEFTAGERFYQRIDEILDSEKIPSIVFETFYYALKRGFKGKYRNSKIQIAKYLDLLKKKIPLSANVQTQVIQTRKSPLGRLKAKQYYAFAFASVALLYGLLYLFGSI